MKIKKSLLLVALILSCSTFSFAEGEKKECPPTPPASADLEKIKSLAGKWQGTMQEQGKEPQPVAIEYKTTSGGSAVIETIFPGTKEEMISVYHDRNGKLSMTHYCLLANQPELQVTSSAGGQLKFEMISSSQEALKGQMHMHSLLLDVSKPGTVVQTWEGADAAGKITCSGVTTLTKAA